MQFAEEQDTCRICSAPSEPDQPLFYPCKCSGTIRYIHQECLTTWLEHSHKKSCDVCKHAYSFTKIYAKDMPARLPPTLLLRQLARQSLIILVFGLRALMVGTVWLAILPWLTIWTWRAFFAAGDLTAWWISDRPHPSLNETTVFNSTVVANKTRSMTPPGFPWSYSYPTVDHLPSDIFAGQIITAILVLIFITIFLLREWISQHVRPGIFDDEQDAGLQEILPLPALEFALDPLDQPPPPLDLPPPLPGVEDRTPDVDPSLIVAPVGARRDLEPVQIDDSRQFLEEFEAEDSADGESYNEPFEFAELDLIVGKETRVLSRKVTPTVSALPRDSKGKMSSLPDVGSSRSIQRRRYESRHGLVKSRTDGEVSEISRLAGEAAMQRLSRGASVVDDSYAFTFRTVPADNENAAGSSSDITSNNYDIDQLFHFGRSAADTGAPGTELMYFGEVDEIVTQRRLSSVDGISPMENAHSSSPPSSPDVDMPRSEVEPFSWVRARRPCLPVSEGQSQTGTPALYATTHYPSASPSLASYRPPEDLDRDASYFNSKISRQDAELAANLIDTDLEHDYALLAEEQSRLINPHPLFAESDYQSTFDIDDFNQYFTEPVDEDEIPAFENASDESEDEIREDDTNKDPPALEPVLMRDVGFEAPEDANPDLVLPDDVDDVDGNFEDDIDGAMEAIGMRGPIFAVLQNAVLMMFVLDTAIALGIWIPFTIGKVTALLSLDPHRFLQVVHFPIRAMRNLTDPIVDFVTSILSNLAIVPLIFFARAFLKVLKRIIAAIGLILPWRAGALHWLSPSQNPVHSSADHLSRSIPTIFDQALLWLIYPYIGPKNAQDEAKPYIINQVFEHNSTLAYLAEPHLAALGKEVRTGVSYLQGAWSRLALGYGATEKVFAILLGYIVVGVMLAIYLNLLTVGNVETAGRAIRNTIRQQLLILKVAVFILVELIAFPLGCGIMLDVCSLWLFPEANLQTRIMFFSNAPCTSALYHWMAGTMFMYEFATMLSACRRIMRSGAMWFVKDPQDSNFQPIRDILDRPALTQVRKLCISAILYSAVIISGMACAAALFFVGTRFVLPLRWKAREPLSSVPVDLLVLHLIVPSTMKYFRPRKLVSRTVRIIWHSLAAKLRISSYMFGGRYDGEERGVPLWCVGLGQPVTNGELRRVPNSDHVTMPKHTATMISVDENGRPLTDAGALAMAAQNSEASKSKRNIATDYTIVYTPPQFRLRIFLFIFIMWSSVAVASSLCVSLPIMLGRRMLQFITERELHDGYSFMVGFYSLWGCYLFGKGVQLIYTRWIVKNIPSEAHSQALRSFATAIWWLAGTLYIGLALGVAIPVMIGIVMDCYIVLPLRLVIDPSLSIKIQIFDTWALGLLYAKIAYFAMRLQPPNKVITGLNAVATLGWMQPIPWFVTTEVIAPIIGGLSVLLLFPAVVLWAVVQVFKLNLTGREIFAYVYPSLFILAALIQAVQAISNLLVVWSQSIRDSVFLVELRLQNLEQSPKAVASPMPALTTAV